MVTDAHGIAANQDAMYGCLVAEGVTASEGFDCGVSLSLMGCSMFCSAGSSLYEEVEYNASASGSIGLWEGSGRV